MISDSLLVYSIFPRRILRTCGLLVSLVLVTLVLSTTANAEPITLLVSPGSLSGSAGTTLIFSGQITNQTGAPLNGSDLFFNFNGFDPAVLTITQLVGDPDFVLPHNTISPVISLFSVTIAANVSPGTYAFEAFLQDINNTFSNTVTVQVSVDGAAVPEPSTLILLTTGLTGFGTASLKRHKYRREIRNK